MGPWGDARPRGEARQQQLSAHLRAPHPSAMGLGGPVCCSRLLDGEAKGSVGRAPPGHTMDSYALTGCLPQTGRVGRGEQTLRQRLVSLTVSQAEDPAPPGRCRALWPAQGPRDA